MPLMGFAGCMYVSLYSGAGLGVRIGRKKVPFSSCFDARLCGQSASIGHLRFGFPQFRSFSKKMCGPVRNALADAKMISFLY